MWACLMYIYLGSGEMVRYWMTGYENDANGFLDFFLFLSSPLVVCFLLMFFPFFWEGFPPRFDRAGFYAACASRYFRGQG